MSLKQIPTVLAIFIILNWAFTTVHSASNSAAPAPAVDCSTVVIKLVDCLSYITNGSTVKKPEGSCCSGLKTVLKSNADCLCEGFKNSGQYGVSLNVTKALNLPSACKISAPAISNCGISTIGAPGLPPMLMPPFSGAPTMSLGANGLPPAPAPAPAPASGSSSSSTLAISAMSLVLGLVFASSLF